MNKKILMCAPHYYDVNYEINPWMNGNVNNVDTVKAKQQWENLYHTLDSMCEVVLIDAVSGLPDMVFTANAGSIINGVFYPSNFKYEERKGEEEHFIKWAKNNYKISLVNSPFEGAGDLLYSGINNIYFMGWGKRTSLSALDEIKQLSGIDTIYPLELVTDQFYHLDTCFCPLSDGSLMVNLSAINSKSWPLLDHIYEGNIIRVNQQDSSLFACNTVNIGEDIIIPYGISKDLESSLIKRNFKIHQLELSEFIKAGGAAKCLTLEV